MNIPTLNQAIEELIAEHKGGKKFFDMLDKTIREDMTDGWTWVAWLNIDMHEKYHLDKNVMGPIIIVSGKFGVHYANWYRQWSERNRTFIVNGGIRDGEPVQGLDAHQDYIKGNTCVFLDDSFYSGRTRDAIAKKIEELGGRLVETFVVYDGSKEKDSAVTSLFRYYEQQKMFKQ